MKNINMKTVMNRKGNVMGTYTETVPAEVMKKVERFGWMVKGWTREVYETEAEKNADREAHDENARKAYNDSYDKVGY